MIKFILLGEGKPIGIFDTQHDLCDWIREAWGLENMTDDEILDTHYENEFSVETAEYHKSKSTIREEIIDKII